GVRDHPGSRVGLDQGGGPHRGRPRVVRLGLERRRWTDVAPGSLDGEVDGDDVRADARDDRALPVPIGDQGGRVRLERADVVPSQVGAPTRRMTIFLSGSPRRTAYRVRGTMEAGASDPAGGE